MKNASRFHRLALMIGIIVIALPMAAPVSAAQTATPEQRAEVRKLVRERNRLHRELEALDERAAEAIKEGETPVGLHAEQVNVQDELDLVQLRLEILATRYSLPIPALPGERDVRTDGDEAEEAERAIEQSLARGRNRAMSRVQADYERFLTSIDFSEFLELSPR